MIWVTKMMEGLLIMPVHKNIDYHLSKICLKCQFLLAKENHVKKSTKLTQNLYYNFPHNS